MSVEERPEIFFFWRNVQEKRQQFQLKMSEKEKTKRNKKMLQAGALHSYESDGAR